MTIETLFPPPRAEPADSLSLQPGTDPAANRTPTGDSPNPAYARSAPVVDLQSFRAVALPERSITQDEVDKIHSEAFRDLETSIYDCSTMASIAMDMVERAITGSEDKHERAMFSVAQVAVMLMKLKADYAAAWHGEKPRP